MTHQVNPRLHKPPPCCERAAPVDRTSQFVVKFNSVVHEARSFVAVTEVATEV